MKNLQKQATQVVAIETYLPVFPGFYSTLFELDTDVSNGELDYLKETYFFEPSRWNFFIDDYIDNSAYETKVAKLACEFISEQLAEYTEKIEFENIQSPREYNFTNDSINCTITPKIETIKQYIYANKYAFETYLFENFKSRDGFSSFYAYDFNSWIEYTNDFTYYSDKTVYLGSILQFICDNENITHENMYYYCCDNEIDFSNFTNYDKIELIPNVLLNDAIKEVSTYIHDNYINITQIDLSNVFPGYVENGLLVDEIKANVLSEIESKLPKLF